MIGLKSGSRIRSFLTGSSRLRSGRYIISSGSNVRSDTSSAYGQQARYIHDGNHIGQKTGDGPEAEKVLRGQDPRGRIRFLKQLLRPDQALSKIKAAFPDVVSIELHAIPFWLVHFCFYLGYDWGRYIGFIPLSANNGFSVSAVHEDHWCSGVILGDDLDVMMQRMRQSRRNGPTALSHDLDYSFASPDGDWDPTVAPLFHYSYPAIDDFAGKAGGSQFEEEQQLQASLGPHKTWAFPYYRPVYLVRTRKGIAYFDASSQGRQYAFKLVETSGRSLRRPGQLLDPMEFRTHFRKPPSKRHPIAQDISLPDERFFKHVEDIFERQKRRGPVSWDDSFIFPLSSKINVDSDGKHATGEQSYNRSVTVNPFNQVAPRRYFEPPKQIPRLLVERHRQTKARDIKSKPRKEPKQPSVIQNLSAEPVETRTRPHRHNSQRDSPGRESSTRREATSNTVIRLPGISPANSSSKLPELQQAITLQRTISEERESILEQEEIRRRKEKERIQQAMARTVNRLSRRNQMPSQAPPPIRVIVKDPVGYYRQLGLVPRGDFVNVGRAVDVDELIKKAWRETAAKKHPDMEGGSHASFLALSKAFRSVRTLDGRIKYNRGHGIDHLNYQP